MVNTVPDILARIVERKRVQLMEAAAVPLQVLEQQAEERARERRDFAAALGSKSPAIIAEFKRSSPSRGVLAADLGPAQAGVEYEAGGAAAMSVLTDEQFFRGCLADLENARGAVKIPVLRKDFTIDRYQVVEAAAHGADAILLIAAILTERQMRDLRELAAKYRMAALVEVHDAGELEPALASGAGIVGVNNRNLRTFEVTLDTSLHLAARIPDSVIRVSESGIHRREDVDLLRNAGYQAFLIGEHLMRSGNPRESLKALVQ